MSQTITIPTSRMVRSGDGRVAVQKGHVYTIVDDGREGYVSPHLREMSRDLAETHFNMGDAPKPKRTRKKADEPDEPVVVDGDSEVTSEETDNGVE